MESGLSKWFYLGIIAIIIGLVLIYRAHGQNKSKLMENGYLIFILGWVGVIAEFSDFASILLLFTALSGIILLLDKLFWAKKRNPEQAKPHYVHYSREFFPVVLGVFILRAFLFEAYQIPSSSMRPGLTVGDFILVNKFEYGIRMPITNKVLIPIGNVKRGDVIVFKDQEVKNRDLIKRAVGLPGDKIEYYNKRLTINGVPLNYTDDGAYNYPRDQAIGDLPNEVQANQYIEDLTGFNHKIITNSQFPTLFSQGVKDFADKNNCTYSGDDGFTCTVPADHYFMMGDNRDDSEDSRYWGFVPNDALLGKAIYVWMNFHDFKRIGTKI